MHTVLFPFGLLKIESGQNEPAIIVVSGQNVDRDHMDHFLEFLVDVIEMQERWPPPTPNHPVEVVVKGGNGLVSNQFFWFGFLFGLHSLGGNRLESLMGWFSLG
jgi:hypothetical protein